MGIADELNEVLDEGKKASAVQIIRNANSSLKGININKTGVDEKASILKELNDVNKTVQNLILEFMR